MAAVNKNSRCGFINTDMEEVIEPRYCGVGDFSNGRAIVYSSSDDNRKCGYIDKAGNEIVPMKYDYALPYNEDLALVKMNEKGYGYLDINGKEVVPCVLGGACMFKNGYAEISIQMYGDWYSCIINKRGKAVIPPKYKGIMEFSEGMAAVRADRLWGFVNEKGKEVILPQYYEVGPFKCGLARVISRIGYSYTHGFIDKTGREVIPCIFNGGGNDASEGYVFVNDGIKTYMIDSLGNKRAEFDYHRIYPFEHGYAKVEYNSK